jgi:four helix bundle protein
LAELAATLQVRRGEGSLHSQLKRAADSCLLNVAEGAARAGRDGAAHFIIARGSAAECAAALDRLGLTGAITQKARWRGRELVARAVAMLTRLGRGPVQRA